MKLACLHAHYSNIEYIENALFHYDVELVHFVDPGLMNRLTYDEIFQKVEAQLKVKEQIEWIAKGNVDAILITCTNYIALLNEDLISIPIPIIKIDEPFFEAICRIEDPQVILFTNPATVDGTMERLYQYAKSNEKTINVEVKVIQNTFEIIMQGLKEKYNKEVSNYLNKIIQGEKKVISVAQLSMVDAAQLVELETSKTIINPLKTLASSIKDQLKLKNKESIIT